MSDTLQELWDLMLWLVDAVERLVHVFLGLVSAWQTRRDLLA